MTSTIGITAFVGFLLGAEEKLFYKKNQCEESCGKNQKSLK